MSVLVLDPETSIFNVLFYILSEFYKKNAYLNIFSFLPKKKKSHRRSYYTNWLCNLLLSLHNIL